MSELPSSMLARIAALLRRPIHLWKKPSDSASTIIERSSLPTSLKLAIHRFVEHSRWRHESKTSLAQTMLRYFTEQLEHGIPTETLVAHWNEAIPSPAFRRLNEPTLVMLHTLPRPVMELIEKVVRRTRLWRSEQVDVARELVAHFQDGVAAGQTPEQMTESFGDTNPASRLIRRAKLRNRPLVWRIVRRTWQTIGILLAVLIVWWMYLLIRFQFSRPNIVHDYIGDIDARSKAVPESDRAWPFYRKALMKMKWNPNDHSSSFIPPLTADGLLTPEWYGLMQPVDIQRIDGRVLHQWQVSPDGAGAPPGIPGVQREYRFNMAEYSNALNDLSRGPYWPAMVQYAQMNDEAFRLILQGAAKPKLGFIFRDSANATWLNAVWHNESASESFEKSTQSVLMGVLLPHIQSIRLLEHLFKIEIEKARLDGNRDRAVELLNAELRIAAQMFQADGLLITKLSALPYSRGACTFIGQTIDEHPTFFTDGSLHILAHDIAAFRAEADLDFHTDLQPFVEDVLQRLYSDDGHQDGHLTAEGWRLLPKLQNIAGVSPGSTTDEQWSAKFQLEGSLMSGVVASRAELKRILDRYYELDLQETRPPLWEINWQGPSPAIEFLNDTLSSPIGRIKYRPLLLWEPLLKINPGNPYQNAHVVGECTKMHCDSTLVALALTMYHRRHGDWPMGLDQLVPELLPVVPLDRFDGKPMKYRLIDGIPAVYSVGRNRTDDGGKWDSDTKPGYECLDGDWRLWPIRTGDK